MLLSMEGHQLVTLESAEVTAEILDEVNSRWVTSDYDSANWITLKEAYDTTPAINKHFDVLGQHIVSCHAKDIWVEDKLAVHLQDGCPGKGNLDFRTVLRRMEALSSDTPSCPKAAPPKSCPTWWRCFASWPRSWASPLWMMCVINPTHPAANQNPGVW